MSPFLPNKCLAQTIRFKCGVVNADKKNTPLSEVMKSKPIIDILAVVSSIDKLDSIESSFHNLGYESKGEHGIKDRRFCVKREDNKRKVHLHMYELNHAEIERHVKFRDILRENASIRIDYEVLKKNLLEQFQENRVQYTEGKTEFINRILNKNG